MIEHKWVDGAADEGTFQSDLKKLALSVNTNQDYV